MTATKSTLQIGSTCLWFVSTGNTKLRTLVSSFLAENHWCRGYELLIQVAGNVVPCSFSCVCGTKHVSTPLRCWTVRFTPSPLGITCQWSVICPVELIICLPMKTQPSSPGSGCRLVGNKVKNELIFCICSDFSEISSQLLTISSRCAPLQGWNIDNDVARLSM